jgi:hypothetical protein
MNTILDLNNLANVNFNNESSYAISFGTNAGNTTATIDAYGSGNIAKQTPLNSITDAVRDLLIDVQFSNVGAVNMSYAGPYSNIGVLQISPAGWRVNGIRSVDQYNEAFANVRYTDLTGSGNTSPEYSYTTTVNDQSGNTRTWSTTVDVRTPPVISNTGNVLFDEDTAANITQLSISGNTSNTSTYVLTSSIRNQAGQVSNTTATGNSVTITGNIATITTAVAAGNLKFVPAPDLATNVANALNFQLSINNNLASQANANVTIGNVHAEFSAPNFDYWEMYDNPFSITVTDLEASASYTSNVIAVTNTGSGNIHTLKANTVASTTKFNDTSRSLLRNNSKASLNAQNLTFRANSNVGLSNVSMVYQQVKTSGSSVIDETANVITVNDSVITGHEFTAQINTSPRYNTTSSYTYDEDQFFRLTNTSTNTTGTVTTQNPVAANAAQTAFRVTFEQVSPDPAVTPGYFGYNAAGMATIPRDYFMLPFSNTPRAQGQVEWYGSLNTVNTATSRGPDGVGTMYLPPPNYTGNIVLNYSQEQIDLVTGEVVVHANAVPITLTVGNTHSEYSNVASITATNLVPFRFNAASGGVGNVINITDQDSANIKTYGATISVASGRLYGEDLISNTSGFWTGDGGTTISLRNPVVLSSIKNLMIAPRWVAEDVGNSNVSIVVTSTWPTTSGLVTVEIANVSIPAAVTQTSIGTSNCDGGRYAGNCIVADGFDAGDYYLLVDTSYTSTTDFLPGSNVVTGLSATSTNDGVSATEYLYVLEDTYFFQPAVIASERVSAGQNGAANYSDWYVASFEEADQIIRVLGLSSGPYWTSSVTADNKVRVINNDRSETLVNLPTGSTQQRFFMCRRIYY